MAPFVAVRGGYTISTDPALLDLQAVHAFLTESYWAKGIPLDIVERAVANSLCFGVYADGEQVGFARVITDRATFGYLADVYVLEAHRGRGTGTWLIKSILAHPELQGFRRMMLITRDSARLYARCGFETPAEPSGIMHIRWTNRYVNGS